MLVSFKRIIKNGWKYFSRNPGLSLGAVFIMAAALLTMTFLFFSNRLSAFLISDLNEKVDISVYFNEGVSSEDISQVKSELSRIPQTKDVEYVSREEALALFIEKHKDDPVLQESLEELGSNPFLASLNIKAWQASQYEQIADFLETSSFKDLINKIDYHQRKPIIDKVSSLTSGINKIGLFFGLFSGLAAILVVFNTVRIVIYNSSEEISVMRLVGASNWFAKGPFVAQGIFVGFIAGIAVFLLTIGVCYGIDPKIKGIIPGISFSGLFLSNLWFLLLIQILGGIILGAISSLIAVRKYLKI